MSTSHAEAPSASYLSRLAIGLTMLTVGLSGALRTFDPVQLAPIHAVFLAAMVAGAWVTTSSLAAARR